MKIFISQPMRGRRTMEIVEERERIAKLFEGNEIIDSVMTGLPEEVENIKNVKVWCLGEAIKKLADADLAVFPNDVYPHDGCAVEYDTAQRYGIPRCCIDMYPDEVRESTGVCAGSDGK